MSQQIESDKLLIKDVFDKWYRIPEYQRPYVWEIDQVTELLDDIYNSCQVNPNSQYFLGSLVLRKTEKTENATSYYEYDVLDGQQRLTTLFLIHAVIRDSISDLTSARYKATSEAIFKQENVDDNEPERMRIIFDIRDKVKEFIYNYVKRNKGTLDHDALKRMALSKDEDISIKNMSQAILTIKGYFSNSHSIDDFYKFLRSNTLMIYVAAEELEDAFHLFTVMNNRGIKLRNSDILKAENLSKINVENDRIILAKLWERIEEYFGEDFDIFLSHLRTILVKNKASYNLLREYEESIYKPRTYNRTTKTYTYTTPLLEKGKHTFDFISEHFDNYQILLDPSSEFLKNNLPIKNRIILMQKGFEADFWTPPFLKYYDKYGQDYLLEFIKKLENKFSSDWITALTPTSRIENMNKLIQKIEDTENSNDLINCDLLEVNQPVLIAMLNAPLYGRKFAKYLLLKLDLLFHGDTTDFSPPDNISIEHILPPNPYDNSSWVRNFTDLQRELWTDRIGNLVLISRRKNSSLGNLDFPEKKGRYFIGNIELFSNSVRIFQGYPTWNFNDLQSNHRDVFNQLLLSYGIHLDATLINNLTS